MEYNTIEKAKSPKKKNTPGPVRERERKNCPPADNNDKREHGLEVPHVRETIQEASLVP